MEKNVELIANIAYSPQAIAIPLGRETTGGIHFL